MDVRERNVFQEGEGRIALDLDDLITKLGTGCCFEKPELGPKSQITVSKLILLSSEP